jgi:hypothetical protein
MTGQLSPVTSAITHLRPAELADPWLKSPADVRHATNVHVYLPRLTTTGTFFRAGHAITARRGAEFAAFVHALLGDVLPPALRHLRSDRIVRDFFGQWEEDYALAQKTACSALKPISPVVRSSETTIIEDIGRASTVFDDSRPPSSFFDTHSLCSEDTQVTTVNDVFGDDESGILDPTLERVKPASFFTPGMST